MPFHHADLPKTFQPHGFRLTYLFGATNYCPGCGGTQWHIGRASAQCGFCATAVPFAGQPQEHPRAA